MRTATYISVVYVTLCTPLRDCVTYMVVTIYIKRHIAAGYNTRVGLAGVNGFYFHKTIHPVRAEPPVINHLLFCCCINIYYASCKCPERCTGLTLYPRMLRNTRSSITTRMGNVLHVNPYRLPHIIHVSGMISLRFVYCRSVLCV